jgi:hypothetical protein
VTPKDRLPLTVAIRVLMTEEPPPAVRAEGPGFPTMPSLLIRPASPTVSGPLTVAAGLTLMVAPSPAMKPSGSLALQLTMVPEAFGRQSA